MRLNRFLGRQKVRTPPARTEAAIDQGAPSPPTEADIARLSEADDVEGLISVLAAGEPAIRSKAAKQLVMTADERAVRPLINALLRDDAWEVRRWAAEALGNVGGAEAVEALKAAAANDPYRCEITGDWVVRRVAQKALDELQAGAHATSPLDRLLARRWREPTSSVVKSAITSLTRRSQSTDDVNATACLDAIEQLARNSEPAVDDAMCYVALTANHGRVRVAAATALKDRASPDIIDLLQEALLYQRGAHPARPARFALEALSIIGDMRAMPGIIRFLEQFSSANRGHPDFIGSMSKGLTLAFQVEEEKEICLAACRALATFDHPDATKTLETLLTDPYWGGDPEIRKELSGRIEVSRPTPGDRRLAVVTLTGHTDMVWACGFSPDGTHIVSGSLDHTVRVWDAASGAELATLTGHAGRVNACGFSPDGTRIVSASDDNTVKVWDAASGAELATLTGHTNAVQACGFNPDGDRIVSGSLDHTVKVWDAASGAELATLTGHTGGVHACGFSPDGTRIVSAGGNTVRVWDAASGAELATHTGHTGSVSAYGFSADGTLIVSGLVVGDWDHTVEVWNAASGAELATLTGVTAWGFSPDGDRIVYGGRDHAVVVWKIASGKVATLTGHTDQVLACGFSPDGTHVVSASRDKTVKVWDAGGVGQGG